MDRLIDKSSSSVERVTSVARGVAGFVGRQLRRVLNVIEPRQVSPYEAAGHTRRTLDWNPPEQTANSGLIYGLSVQRSRSRHAARNDGYAKGTIDRLVTNIVGTGIKPLSQAPDPNVRAQIHELFERWTDESDADGLLDFYGLQSLVAREWLEGGECFIRRRPRLASDGLSVPLQLQVIEPEQLPTLYNTNLSNGNRVRGGIEFDPIGRRVAYWFYAERPDLDILNVGVWRRVPADQIAHVFDPLRAGQNRGVPLLSPALLRFLSIDKIDDATITREYIANLFAGFVKLDVGIGQQDNTSRLTGLTTQTTGATAQPTVSMEPGTLQQLDPGETIEFSKPPGAGAHYGDFIKHQLRGACAATGVPYEVVTGDMSGLNDRIMRVLLGEFRRRVMASQHQGMVYQACRPEWEWWFDAAVLSGKLTMPADYFINPARWRAVKWMPQGWPYINPVQDIEASRDAVRNGFSSRSAEVSQQGEDAEIIDQQNKADNARADNLGVKYDSDGRNPVNGKGAPPPPPSE